MDDMGKKYLGKWWNMDIYEQKDLEIPNMFQQFHRSNVMKHDGQNRKKSTEIERFEISARVDASTKHAENWWLEYDPASF